jgi:chemotaxis signal transduction protein
MGLLDGEIERQYFLFSLGKRTFGVPIADVAKVISIDKVYTVPLLEDFFWGFILHDDKPIPFINLKKKLKLAGQADNEIGVLVRVGQEMVAFSIDGSYEVVQVAQEPTPIPMEFKGAVKDIFTARGTHNNRNFIILNVNALVPAS